MGRVMLEEGTPPPDTVVIERICGGNVKAEGYTDSRGYFSIELGNESMVFQDASETGNLGNSGGIGGLSTGTTSGGVGGRSNDTRYTNCDLRGRLVGFRSQTISLANRRPMDDPNIGTILLHREGHDEGSTVSAVSLAAPRDARHAYEKGMQFIKKSKKEEAEKEFEKAVHLYPKYATAWDELGRLQVLRGDNEAARASFNTAIEADPKYVNPYLQISLLEMDGKNWKALADVTAKALKLDPFDYPQAFLFNAVANWNLKNFDASDASLAQAERLDHDHRLPEVSHLRGLLQLMRHDLPGAVTNLRLYLKLAPDADDAATVRAQLAQMEKVMAATAAAKAR